MFDQLLVELLRRTKTAYSAALAASAQVMQEQLSVLTAASVTLLHAADQVLAQR